MIEPIKFDNHVHVMLAYIYCTYFMNILNGCRQLVFKDELTDKISTRNNDVQFQWNAHYQILMRA